MICCECCRSPRIPLLARSTAVASEFIECGLNGPVPHCCDVLTPTGYMTLEKRIAGPADPPFVECQLCLLQAQPDDDMFVSQLLSIVDENESQQKKFSSPSQMPAPQRVITVRLLKVETCLQFQLV